VIEAREKFVLVRSFLTLITGSPDHLITSTNKGEGLATGWGKGSARDERDRESFEADMS
jgi:hypothetical protein